MLNDYIVVIQAGGKGTRLKELTRDKLPKPLLKINGKPMIEWQIENASKCGIREFLIIVGHLGEQIKDYFQDGAKWGIHISYIEEQMPLGSAGALYYLRGKLGGKTLILIFGDVMFDMDLERMVRFHEKNNALATLAVHPNTHPYDSDLVIMNNQYQILGISVKTEKRPHWYRNIVNAGIYVLSADMIEKIMRPQKLDLEKDLILPNVGTGKVYGYQTTEYIKDAGTSDRFREVCQEQGSGLWESKNLRKKQRCVFLDRDGTLNVYKGLIADSKAFELEKDAAKAVRFINRSGYLAIAVTNQPVVAKGMCGISDVERIHEKMQALLGEQGAYLDDIIFCPHHPDRGFPEENVQYKIPCNCRKPGTGMIMQMADKHNIDLEKSYMVGDSTVDIQTGINAGLKTALVHTGVAGKDGKYDVMPDMEGENLLDVVESIIKI